MYTYMEYLQKCFYKSTNWNEDNILSNITATSQALLEFPIPNGCKLDISSKSTEYSASSFTLSNYLSVNGSLAYLYSSIPLKNTMGTKEVSLQDAIAGFKIIEPNFSSLNTDASYNGIRDTLLYGRMYFPGSALEAMLIKRISKQTQLLVKCINNPHLDKNGTMIVYLQKNTPRFSREFIYSTNEALFGFRCLYNFGNSSDNSSSSKYQNNNLLIPKFDNSVISIGTEIWYAALSMSPGLSTAFRYSTRSTSTGKPLTMTLACNPILGHISSTYTVKTSVSSTFCSKYDFNFFSYASNLSLGFELYNYSNKNTHQLFTNQLVGQSSEENRHLLQQGHQSHNEYNNNDHTIPIKSPILFAYKSPDHIINPFQNLDNYYHINPTLLSSQGQNNVNIHSQDQSEEIANESVMTAFQSLVNESDFSSVVKFSTSLNNRMIKLLWEGRCKDFLVSTGVKVGLNTINNTPEFNRFGVTLSYAC